MTKQKIYLGPILRWLILNNHKFFMEQIKERVFDNFTDAKIKEDTEKVKEKLYEQQFHGRNDKDTEQIAKYIENQSCDFCIMLYEMRGQIAFSILTSLYHKWERDLRRCIERKSEVGSDTVPSKKNTRKGDVGYLLDELKRLGWDIGNKSWFPKIEACRLIVNVYKHSEGGSLDKLKKKYPQFLQDDCNEIPCESDKTLLFYGELSITPEDFEEFADAFKQFWVDFPGESL